MIEPDFTGLTPERARSLGDDLPYPKGGNMSYTSEEMVANAERHYRQAVKWAATGMNPEGAKVQALSGLLAMQLAHYAIGTKHDRAPWPSVDE